MRAIFAAAATAVLILLSAVPQAQAQPTTVDEAYAPYARLIGAWESNGGQIVQRFSWGPGHGYILYSTTTSGADGADHIHFEGILVYNAQTQNLDFLIALEPGTLGQERGVVRVEPDGAIVRDVELIRPNAASNRFRQTFRLTSADVGETSLMRDDGQGGWTPNFPGSDRLAMRRVG
jgi:hypothetical protein